MYCTPGYSVQDKLQAYIVHSNCLREFSMQLRPKYGVCCLTSMCCSNRRKVNILAHKQTDDISSLHMNPLKSDKARQVRRSSCPRATSATSTATVYSYVWDGLTSNSTCTVGNRLAVYCSARHPLSSSLDIHLSKAANLTNMPI